MGAGLRPGAKATEMPPDPTTGAPVLDSTIRIDFAVPAEPARVDYEWLPYKAMYREVLSRVDLDLQPKQ